jgi:hypothetical protein
MTERTPPRWKVTDFRGHDNYECTRCPFAVLGDKAAMVRHADREHPLAKDEPEPLVGFNGINFASDEAAEYAQDLAAQGFTPDRLRARRPSGKNGFTKADVRAAAATMNEE